MKSDSCHVERGFRSLRESGTSVTKSCCTIHARATGNPFYQVLLHSMAEEAFPIFGHALQNLRSAHQTHVSVKQSRGRKHNRNSRDIQDKELFLSYWLFSVLSRKTSDGNAILIGEPFFSVFGLLFWTKSP